MDSIHRIQESLFARKEGLRFSEIKKQTGLHQTTLSKRLKELLSFGYVGYDPIKRVYSVSDKTRYDDLETRELLRLIEESVGRLVIGGPHSGSLYPDDDLIAKSLISYAFPAVQVDIPGDIGRVVHKYLFLLTISSLARNHKIDPRYLSGEKPIEDLVNELRKIMHPHKQVLAFIVDFEKIIETLNVEYIKEILRIATIESDQGIVSSHNPTPYLNYFRKYAAEVSALELIRSKEKVRLEDIAKHLGLDVEKTREILDDLLVEYAGPHFMELYDKDGKFKERVKLWPKEEEIQTPGGLAIRMKLQKSKAFLEKISDKSGIYYCLADKTTELNRAK